MLKVTKFSPIDIVALLGDAGGQKGKSESLADFARSERDKAIAINRAALGRDAPYETTVDGRKTTMLESVKPDGRIFFEWSVGLQSDVIQWILDQLRLNSPVGTKSKSPGRYRASHTIYADNVKVESPQGIDAGEWVIVSTVPYARKIERGQKGYAPGKVYEGVAALAAMRFNNLARVRYTYRSPEGTETMLVKWATKNALKQSTLRKQATQHAKNLRNPAILVLFK